MVSGAGATWLSVGLIDSAAGQSPAAISEPREVRQITGCPTTMARAPVEIPNNLALQWRPLEQPTEAYIG